MRDLQVAVSAVVVGEGQGRARRSGVEEWLGRDSRRSALPLCLPPSPKTAELNGASSHDEHPRLRGWKAVTSISVRPRHEMQPPDGRPDGRDARAAIPTPTIRPQQVKVAPARAIDHRDPVRPGPESTHGGTRRRKKGYFGTQPNSRRERGATERRRAREIICLERDECEQQGRDDAGVERGSDRLRPDARPPRRVHDAVASSEIRASLH